jgi:hypothetical protein
MARKLIKINELLDIMNGKLANFDTCIECRFNSIMPLKDFDESGCNWSHANLNCRGYPATICQSANFCEPATVCIPVATRVISEVKERYNVR